MKGRLPPPFHFFDSPGGTCLDFCHVRSWPLMFPSTCTHARILSFIPLHVYMIHVLSPIHPSIHPSTKTCRLSYYLLGRPLAFHDAMWRLVLFFFLSHWHFLSSRELFVCVHACVRMCGPPVAANVSTDVCMYVCMYFLPLGSIRSIGPGLGG